MARRPKGLEEWTTATGALVAALSEVLKHVAPQLEKLTAVTESVGFVTFLAGLVLAIQKFNDTTQSLVWQNALVNVAARLDELSTNRDKGSVHVLAGSRLLREYATSDLSVLVDHLKELRDDRASFTLEEPYFIPRLLRLMVENLEEKSTWFGVTYLTKGWRKEHADPGYYGFAEALRSRVHAGTLRVFRIYCIATDVLDDEFKETINKESQAGVVVKFLRYPHPPDMTLLWPPCSSVSIDNLRSAQDPISTLNAKGCRPICGMRFDTREALSLDKLEIFAGGSKNFGDLEQAFRGAWNRAVPAEGFFSV